MVRSGTKQMTISLRACSVHFHGRDPAGMVGDDLIQRTAGVLALPSALAADEFSDHHAVFGAERLRKNQI